MTDLTKDDIRLIITEVLDQARPRREVIRETVHETLIELGVDYEEPMEMQKDFQHLREWRITMEQAKSKSVMATVGFLIAGLVALIWLGIKTFLHIEL